MKTSDEYSGLDESGSSVGFGCFRPIAAIGWREIVSFSADGLSHLVNSL